MPLNPKAPLPRALSQVATRQEVLQHAVRDVSAERWRREIAHQGLRTARGPLSEGRSITISRQDVFGLGARDITPENALQLWYYSVAWGLGEKGFRMRARLGGLAAAGDHAGELLCEAWTSVRAGSDPRDCYERLLTPGGRPFIRYFGSAFATKYLYFAHGDSEPTNLVLDAVVARNLRTLGVWPSAPTTAWWSATYQAYCTLLSRWAQELTVDPEESVRADQLEMTLFKYRGQVTEA